MHARYARFPSRSAWPMKATTAFAQGHRRLHRQQGGLQPGHARFRAKLDNKDHLLTPGLFVRVRLPIGDAHQAVMIRERAW